MLCTHACRISTAPWDHFLILSAAHMVLHLRVFGICRCLLYSLQVCTRLYGLLSLELNLTAICCCTLGYIGCLVGCHRNEGGDHRHSHDGHKACSTCNIRFSVSEQGQGRYYRAFVTSSQPCVVVLASCLGWFKQKAGPHSACSTAIR